MVQVIETIAATYVLDVKKSSLIQLHHVLETMVAGGSQTIPVGPGQPCRSRLRVLGLRVFESRDEVLEFRSDLIRYRQASYAYDGR